MSVNIGSEIIGSEFEQEPLSFRKTTPSRKMSGLSGHGRWRRVNSDAGTKNEETTRTIESVDKIAAVETTYLTISRIIVILIILVVAAMVSTGTFIFLDGAEEKNYDNRYEYVTNTARDAVEFHVRNVYSAARSLSRILSEEAGSLGDEFPFVTFHTFETLCSNARDQGRFEVIFYHPWVDETNLPNYNSYTVENQGWIQESQAIALSYSGGGLSPSEYIDEDILPGVYSIADGLVFAPEYVSGPGPHAFMPLWMQSPPPFRPSLVNFDAYHLFRITMDAALESREGIMSDVQDVSLLAGNALREEDHARFHQNIVLNQGSNYFDHPHTFLFVPIFEQAYNETSRIVGMLSLLIAWDAFMTDLVPDGTGGVTVVVKNTCGQAYTYVLDGNEAFFSGEGDLHETKYDSTEVILPFHDLLRYNETSAIWGHCVYNYHLYQSQEFEDLYYERNALRFTVVVACTFFFIIVVFFSYDWFLVRRNNKVLDVAAKTSAIVSNLFPSNVRDRLLNADDKKNVAAVADQPDDRGTKNKMTLKNFLQSEVELDSTNGDNTQNDQGDYAELHVYGSKPIADIFPETTILFADIVGFTAWSSTREPSQVFTLLENIYKSFDDIATRRRVFKVETVGDCYVAVCGLPDPRSDHAVVMARFARACLKRMQELVHKLEVMLGPDTADLSMRMGLHSGPVTAGVLRGERARFQLFGDTMNTASRMESTGEKGMIQLSQETADLLSVAGKGSWIYPREAKVVAKGKGQLQTYWLANEGVDHRMKPSLVENGIKETVLPEPAHLEKSERLVKWNGDLLLKLLKDMEALRDQLMEDPFDASKLDVNRIERRGTVLDEVQEIVHLPHFHSKMTRNPNTIQLSTQVEQQLLDYIAAVSALYRDNPFHCFEHASHVTMSVSKLMSRIIAPDLSDEEVGEGNVQALLHDHTYGITSDPLTQFACVFSALIHDVDHTGVPNTQLARENPQLAELYGGRSIAEQNSVDIAWNLLMQSDYAALRNAIYKTPAEEQRFRQLVVNSVMATDIMDKDLKQLRNRRWDSAFEENERKEESQKNATDRKATIVIEHLIQASDVSHTMQHWHIYRKWNQRLFCELYEAYIKGRADRDPAEYWYNGELGFFDFYIIPLAKKLKDCGVFGVSSDEYLNYATKNRQEWEQRGKEVVAEMVDEVKAKYPTQSVKSSELASNEPLRADNVCGGVSAAP